MNVSVCFPEKQIEGSFLFWGVRSTSHPICSGLKHIGMVSLISNIFFISWNIPFRDITPFWLGFPGGSVGKESACNSRDLGSIPRSGRSPGEGNGNPPQYSCLENSRERGAWWGYRESQRVRQNWGTSIVIQQSGRQLNYDSEPPGNHYGIL